MRAQLILDHRGTLYTFNSTKSLSQLPCVSTCLILQDENYKMNKRPSPNSSKYLLYIYDIFFVIWTLCVTKLQGFRKIFLKYGCLKWMNWWSLAKYLRFWELRTKVDIVNGCEPREDLSQWPELDTLFGTQCGNFCHLSLNFSLFWSFYVHCVGGEQRSSLSWSCEHNFLQQYNCIPSTSIN